VRRASFPVFLSATTWPPVVTRPNLGLGTACPSGLVYRMLAARVPRPPTAAGYPRHLLAQEARNGAGVAATGSTKLKIRMTRSRASTSLVNKTSPRPASPTAH
jgi:hypothetical protein